MKIVFLDTKTVGVVPNISVFKELGEYISYQLTKPEEVSGRIQGAEVVITNKVIINKEIIDNCPSLKLICIAATGMNNIDTVYATEKGIMVKNVENYSTDSVAQVTVGMILQLVNQINYFDAYVKSGDYTKSDMFTHFGPPVYNLKGKRLGIIGLGNIGKQVALIMESFGMEIVYYSTSGNNKYTGYKRVELNELLISSDIVTIHSPLNEHTRNLITLSELKLMKPSAIIINAGRGGIIHEKDLVEAVNSDLIAGAGIDVYEKEPMHPESPFRKIGNPHKFILLPHVAWSSVEARMLLINKIVENIQSFFEKLK